MIPQEFPNASFKDVVRANVDTLYTKAWLDLTKEPMVHRMYWPKAEVHDGTWKPPGIVKMQ